MIRWGLCCIFREQPIRFRQATAAALRRSERSNQLAQLSALCLANLRNLEQALRWVAGQGIGAFRIASTLFPRFTHPEVGYRLEDLPDYEALIEQCAAIKRFRMSQEIRLSLHPDQFNVLSSPHDAVIASTLRELEYQGLVAELLGAEVINLHAGGVYGNKHEALARLRRNFRSLSARVASRLSLENDDRSYGPADLMPLCAELGIPFIYDIHHHRCLPDGWSVEQATEHCAGNWQRLGREPYFHISSPRDGWQAANPRWHAEYIDPADFPVCWRSLDATVDVEAKAKELAVLRLRRDLAQEALRPPLQD